jgi:hypothetical protein
MEKTTKGPSWEQLTEEQRERLGRVFESIRSAKQSLARKREEADTTET